MKISKAIEILQRLLQENGDSELYIAGYDESDARDTRLDKIATDIEDWYDEKHGVVIS